MRRRKLLTVTLLLAVGVGPALLTLPWRSSVLFDVISDDDFSGGRRLVIFFPRSRPATFFTDRYQARVSGHWTDPQTTLGGMARGFGKAPCLVPIEADACRLFVEESPLSPSERLYSVLDRCGIAVRAPTLCAWVVRHVPDKRPPVRHITVEITLPRKVHNQSIEPTGGSRFSASALLSQRRLPPDQ
jgi:hypothetical protein